MPALAWRNDADGFAFANNWVLDPTERGALAALAQPLIPVVVGTVLAAFPLPDPLFVGAIWAAASAGAAFGVNRSYGLCGGMAYSSLDHWHARVALPRGCTKEDQPARTAPIPTALRDYIWRRLLDSLGPGHVLARTLEWSLLLNQLPGGLGVEILRNRSQQEWDLMRSRIDAGAPCPIGLVLAHTDVWDQHQILVYGYEEDGPQRGKLLVYDSNTPSQFGEAQHLKIAVDFRGPGFIAKMPTDATQDLAGFFCSDYVAAPPMNVSKEYGGFQSWTGNANTWMVTDGARMALADVAELVALGGTSQAVRPTGGSLAPSQVRPRDGAIFRERSSTACFLYAGGAPFALPDAMWVDRLGGDGSVRVVPDGRLAAFNRPPDEGTLLREWSDAKVWRIMAGVRRWMRTPQELDRWGGFVSVRVVPDGALGAIPVGAPLPVDAQQAWHWDSMGKPENANIRAWMGAVTVMDRPDAPQRPHVFFECNDFNLWCRWSDGSAWHWLNMGKPAGANITGLIGAVTQMDTPTAPQRAHVFVTGSDGHVWCRWSDASAWHWSDLGKPSGGVRIRGMMGAVTVMDTPTSGQRPHVFVECSDANLWCLWWSGSSWNWLNMGKPAGANITGLIGAVTQMDTPTAPQRAHVFVTGSDGHVWCRWSDSSAWHWSDLGKPGPANIRGLLGAVTVKDTPASGQRPHVFVECNDGMLWCLWWSGSSWSWLDMGKPNGANIIGPMGVVTQMDTPTSPQRVHLFVAGSDGNMWCRWSDGSAWQWSNMGKPASANIRGLMGAVTVMDTPSSGQRPHVFTEGNDYNLWVDWWG